MRPAAVEKMGYYPTHEQVVRAIASYIQPAVEEAKARLLDPCAGEGSAAALLGSLLGCVTWGCELSYARAALAEKVLDRLYQAGWENVSLSEESISLLFLNPPYDNDRESKKRFEVTFLKSAAPKLMRGGLLVYIVPQRILSVPEIARVLAGHFENYTVGRYRDSAYGQVVVLATRRAKYHVPNGEEMAAIQQWAEADLPVLEAASAPTYRLLPAPARDAAGRPVRFTRMDWTREEIAEAALARGVSSTPQWKHLIQPDIVKDGSLRPVMPLKKGHIAMLMASGMMGTVRILDADGAPMLVKGRVVKKQEVVASDDDGETLRDRFITTVAKVTQAGIQIINDVQGLTEFMRASGDQLAAHVMSTYTPLYNMDPTPQETAILDTLGRTRKPLPGQKEAGLLSTQKHVAAAMARALKAKGNANLQGEMGVGKTTVSAATLELLHAYPALIICPPHLVPKWIREVEETIPGAKAREIRRIGRNAEDPADVNDVRTFLEDCAAGRLGRKPVAVVASTSAKMGTGWSPAFVQRTNPVPVRDAKSKKDIYLRMPTCPVCGHPVLEDIDGKEKELTKKRLFCQGQVDGWEVDSQGRKKRDANGNPVWGKRICGAPLFSCAEARRYSIAEYIAKHYKGAFKLLITDEVHQMSAKASDRGIAFHQLVTACKYTLTLTGTFFGGKSTSIFWLLHRLNSGVRREFGFNDEMRWARLYGVLEMRRKSRNEDDGEEDGAFTGNRRYLNKAKEQPGVSPEIIRWLLDTTAFISLKDLGVFLPDYREEVAALEMEAGLHAPQYEQMERSLKELAKRSGRYLSVWLQWALARPNSAFRDEKVIVDEIEWGERTGRKSELMQLPAVIQPTDELPKEDWLAKFCLAERRQGRKVLVYLRQTGTRDIQDRIKEVLERSGLRVTILSGNVDPRKREAWINQRLFSTDVLVCNPRLVETGLDLIAFATVVFAEIEYSLYTLWQAVRRVWRLGQEKPVKAVFAVYNGAMESLALALMGRKMKAAQLLYGDEVGGAIVPESEGDFLTQLARDVLADVKLPDLAALFAEDARMSSNDPLGSMTLPSASIPSLVRTWDDWMKDRGVLPTAPQPRRRSSRPVSPSRQQASLF